VTDERKGRGVVHQELRRQDIAVMKNGRTVAMIPIPITLKYSSVAEALHTYCMTET